MSNLTPEELALAALKQHLRGENELAPLAIREFWIPKTRERADLAVINGDMHGFEIKSARDTLKRLPRQVAAYGRVFDRCTAVLAPDHLHDALEILPDWWGVLLLPEDADGCVSAYRNSELNPRTDAETQVRLLWKDEAAAALDRLDVRYEPSSSRANMWRSILESQSAACVGSQVRHAILTRDVTKARIDTRRFREQASATT